MSKVFAVLRNRAVIVAAVALAAALGVHLSPDAQGAIVTVLAAIVGAGQPMGTIAGRCFALTSPELARLIAAGVVKTT